MNRRELLKKVGLFPIVLLAGGAVGSGVEKLSGEYQQGAYDKYGWECFPLVCRACGKPLSILRQKADQEPVALGCMECNRTPAVTGTDWDSIVRKWIDFRTVLSRDVLYVYG